MDDMDEVTLYAWCDNPEAAEEYMHDLAAKGRAVLVDGGQARDIQGSSGRYRVVARAVSPRKPVRREA